MPFACLFPVCNGAVTGLSISLRIQSREESNLMLSALFRLRNFLMET